MFFILSRARYKENVPWEIEPQTFTFLALMLYLWAIEILWLARPITKFIWLEDKIWPYQAFDCFSIRTFKTRQKLSIAVKDMTSLKTLGLTTGREETIIQLSTGSNPQLLWLYLTLLCDWPSSQPIRCKTKNNCVLINRIFPRFKQFVYFHFEFSPMRYRVEHSKRNSLSTRAMYYSLFNRHTTRYIRWASYCCQSTEKRQSRWSCRGYDASRGCVGNDPQGAEFLPKDGSDSVRHRGKYEWLCLSVLSGMLRI